MGLNFKRLHCLDLQIDERRARLEASGAVTEGLSG